MGTISKLRRMVLRDGLSVREAARQLNISRNTATKWLAYQMRIARFPAHRDLANFSFEHAHVDEALIREVVKDLLV